MIKNLLLVLCILLLISCGANKALTSTVKPEELSEMAYFEPISYISLVEKGNNPLPSDSLSAVANFRLDSVIQSRSGKYRISKKLIVEDVSAKQKLQEEISRVIRQLSSTKKIKDIPTYPTIDSLMHVHNTRFAMASITHGFGRRKGNYGGQAAKGAAVGILTLGLYAPIPIKSNLSIYTVIFDAEKKEIAYYRQSPVREKSPTDGENLAKDMDWIFDGYFYSSK